MECKICNTEQTIRSMAMHLKHNHNIKTGGYILEYGEFRPKQLEKLKKLDKSSIKCQICGQEMAHNRQLMYHLTKEHHNITQEEYIIKYELKNIHPTCKCGCGGKTLFLRHGKDSNGDQAWFREYIKGHWDWVKPGYNTHSKITKDLMSEKAKLRIKGEVKKQGYANIHNPKTLKERREKRKNNFIQKIEEINNVVILNKDQIETVASSPIFRYSCNECNLVWEQKTFYPRCIGCNPYEYNNISLEEKELINFILQHYPKEKLILNNRTKIKPYEIDIIIPELNLGIEYSGLYWHSEIHKKDKNYHFKKFQLSEQNGLKLIQVFSDEWLNKKEIVQSRILNELKLTPIKIYGRKCNIREIIDPKMKNQFLNKNHIQGEDRSKIKLGLYYNDELVSVMTFGLPRRAIGMKLEKRENEYELIRFCNKLNTNVIGGASKLLKYFIKNYKPKHIYSFADNRWSSSSNNLYTRLGFELTNKSLPGYWYTKNFTERLHRFNFNKNKLKQMGFDTENNTEHDIMNSIKYYKVWDCGTTRYELDIE